ncbi:MAG: hypothetical protein P8J79_12760 [Halioglobus sp.]|nr:hypothetical protein [Halioglobus sp.]
MTSRDTKSEVLSDQLMSLLQERVEDRNLAKYLDELIPAYELPDAYTYELDDRKLVYQVSDFMNYFDAEFVEVAYLCLFKRSADASGLMSALHGLRFDKSSRIYILGTLRYSEEGRRTGVKVSGLKVRYFFARVRKTASLGSLTGVGVNLNKLLRKTPVLGSLVAAVANLHKLPKLDPDVGEQNAKSVANIRKLSSLEHVIPDRHNDVIENSEQTYRGENDVTSSAGSSEQVADGYQLSLVELTSLPSAEYLDLIYDLVLGRKPSPAEKHRAMECLASGYRSKIRLAGDLYALSEARGHVGDIPGLSAAYRTEKILSTPWIGPILQIPRAIRTLSRLDLIIAHQSRENLHQLSAVETRLMLHRNRILARLKSALAEAAERENTQR